MAVMADESPAGWYQPLGRRVEPEDVDMSKPFFIVPEDTPAEPVEPSSWEGWVPLGVTEDGFSVTEEPDTLTRVVDWVQAHTGYRVLPWQRHILRHVYDDDPDVDPPVSSLWTVVAVLTGAAMAAGALAWVCPTIRRGTPVNWSQTTRVTLRIERKESGGDETYTVEARSQWVIPLVLRAVNAALGAHSGEAHAIRSALTVLLDFKRAAGRGSDHQPSKV